MYTTSSQRPYSVHTTFPQSLYSVHDVSTARKQLLRRVHCVRTAFSRHAHSVFTEIIVFHPVTYGGRHDCFRFRKHPSSILIDLMKICFILKMHCKRLLQMQDLHGVFTACTWHAHSALEDPTHSIATARCLIRCANAKPQRVF